MTEQFANNASSTLNGAILIGATSLVVTSAAKFPNSPNFRVLLGVDPLTAEIVLVTGVAGNTFTIVRAQEGTAASAWPDLTAVTHILTAGAIYQVITGGGDLTGTVENATVAKIKGKPVATQTLGASQDGYVLTWVNTDGYWAGRTSNGTTVQNGKNYSTTFDVGTFSNIASTASTTFVTASTFEFDPTLLTAANGTRTISLKVLAETTGPQITIQLFNYTTASVVTGSTLTTSSTTPTALSTGDLSANLTAGSANYQVQIKMAAGGTSSDRVVLDMAKLRIIWS